MEDLQGFPTFQWSAFPHGKEGEQLVIRGNNFEEFVTNIEQIKTQFIVHNGVTQVAQTTTPIVMPTVNAKVCPNCGSTMEHKGGVTNGKAWGGWFCTNGPKGCGAKPLWD